MSLTLYHSVESTCSQKVRFVLCEKHLQWQEINLNLRKGDQFKPEYLKLNRKAVVPTLLHDDQVIRESTVIIDYLDDVFPQPALKPAEPIARAAMRLLLKSFDEEVHPSVGILSYAIVLRHQMNSLKSAEALQQHFSQIVDPMRRQRQQRTHEEGLRSPTAAVAISTLRKVAELMQELLADNTWLTGADFSLADACAAPYMVRINNIGLASIWQDKPELQQWLERVKQRLDAHPLADAWGSASFSEMVSAYVDNSRAEIEQFLHGDL